MKNHKNSFLNDLAWSFSLEISVFVGEKDETEEGLLIKFELSVTSERFMITSHDDAFPDADMLLW